MGGWRGSATRTNALSDDDHGGEKKIGRRSEGHWQALIHSATANSFERRSTCANSSQAVSGVGSFVGSMKSLFASHRIAMPAMPGISAVGIVIVGDQWKESAF